MYILSNIGQIVPAMTKSKLVHGNQRAFHPSHRSLKDDNVWEKQCDQTKYVGEFERLSFITSRCLLYVPTNQCVTIDDELMETHSQGSPVETIPESEWNREGQLADCIADALLRFSLY